MHHQISWAEVQRILLDAPGVEDTDGQNDTTEITLTDDNADKVLEMINKLNR